ncbi:hypothetical protein HMPREF0424_0546 [Gardnerella vaginalis 409-05]|nr:hypothetical protein HMPREF0424_0546 [Gardnerella vaginalis 409-05]
MCLTLRLSLLRKVRHFAILICDYMGSYCCLLYFKSYLAYKALIEAFSH